MVTRRTVRISGIISFWGVAARALTNISPIQFGPHLVSRKRRPLHIGSLGSVLSIDPDEKKKLKSELKMTRCSAAGSDGGPEEKRSDEQSNCGSENQPKMSWDENEAMLNQSEESFLDDYCSVYDDYGCEAFEDLAKSLDEKVNRWIRVEARPDATIQGIQTREDVLRKIDEVRSYQKNFGNSELYQRRWNCETGSHEAATYINGSGPAGKKKPAFSVLQFNMLAEGLSSGPGVKTPFKVEKNSDDGEGQLKNSYGGFSQVPHPEICLDFSLRRWRLLEVMLGLTSVPVESNSRVNQSLQEQNDGIFDILAVEEIDRFRGFFAPLLRLFGYEGVFMPKTKSPGVPLGFYSDGCALFWKTKVFESISEERFQFSVGNQVMLLATLRHLESGIPLIVAITHLKAQKSDTNEMIRCKQVEELLRHVHRAALASAEKEGLKDINVVIAGDFNADAPPEVTTTTSSVRCMLSNHLKSESVDETKQELLKFYSAYPVDPPSDGFFTTYKTRGTDTVKRIIDYIFYSDSLTCTHTLSIPELEALEDGLLPGLRYPSDHLMLGAKFEMNRNS